MNTQPLSPEEFKFYNDFIVQCVTSNIVLQSASKFMRELRLPIQEIVHSNIGTLRDIGIQLEKVANEAGSSKFSLDGPLKLSGIDADKWIDFLALQIRICQLAYDTRKKESEIAKLEKELEQFKTPGEKRTEIETRLNELKGISVAAAQTA